MDPAGGGYRGAAAGGWVTPLDAQVGHGRSALMTTMLQPLHLVPYYVL